MHLSLSPPSVEVVGIYPGSQSSSNDIVFGATHMFSVAASGSIRIHDQITGQTLDFEQYDAGYNLSGLAYIPVPGPASLTMLALLLLGRRSRQH